MREEETDAACRPFSRVFSFPPPAAAVSPFFPPARSARRFAAALSPSPPSVFFSRVA